MIDKALVKKIVLFGSSGQLGQDILKVLSSDSSLELILPSRSDIKDQKILNKIFNSLLKDDVIINSIAMTNTGLCEDEIENAYAINAFWVHDLAKRCKENELILFQISTDYIFSGNQDNEYDETDLPCPLSIYGASKLAGEQMALAYCDKHFIFRVSSLYGNNSKNGNFVETMLGKAKLGEGLSVVADQFSSPTHTLDIARVIYTFIKDDIIDYGIYHVTNKGRASWHEFTMQILNVFGYDSEVKKVSHTDFPAKLKRPICAVLSNTKIDKIYEMPTWQEALSEYKNLKR